MKVALIILSLTLFFTACSTKQKNIKDNSSRISSFINLIKSETPDRPNVQAYISNYEEYLKSVYDLFGQNGEQDKFNTTYMQSLEKNNNILKNLVQTLPQKYAQETKKKANIESKDFQLYKTKVITQTYDELNQARVESLKNNLGSSLFNKLVDHNRAYNSPKGQPDPRYLFPL